MKNYKFKQFLENLFLISIILIVIYFIISFIISTFSITKFKLPSLSMPKFDYNITMPTINTDFLLDKFKNDNNITIKENNTTTQDINKTIKNEDDTNISFEMVENIELNNTIIKNIDTNISNVENNISDKNITIVKLDSNISKEVNETIVKEDINLTLKNEIKIDPLEQYINNAIAKINLRKNKVRFAPNEKNYIKIKFRVKPNGKFHRLIYISGNKDLIGEARIAIRRAFPIKPNEDIKSKFPRFITTTLTYN